MSATGPQLNPGDTLPGTKYKIVKSLGAGGMGIVYQVVKPPNIGGVLKLMSAELTAHQEHRIRFFDEVRILAQLDHPNIVKVFDYEALADGTPFYVMELLSGRTVRDVITTMGRVPPRVAYEVSRQLLEALQAAHTHDVPVIHRDIKPENIFLHAPRHGEPVVKLIDFGVSAVADRKHDGSFVGTWSYAAPEQIRGELPTPATDLYAVGLVLYEMLAGVGPFDHHDDWTKVSEAQMRETPAPVSKFAPWVPASIVSLIASALAKDARLRPKDAYQFAERLFELEWASDGKDPHDLTLEGPSPELAARLAMATAHRMGTAPGAPIPRKPRANTPIEVTGTGPLSRVLSTVASETGQNPSSKNMAAAKPATDRLGDVPLIGVPPESVRAGPTWRGVGTPEPTSPDASALLAGLGAQPRKPLSKKERESDPDAVRANGKANAVADANVDSSPRPGQFVIRAGKGALASAPHEEHGPTTPRSSPIAPHVGANGSAAVTLDQVVSAAPAAAPATAMRVSGSFSSSSDARVVQRPRTAVYILIAASIFGLVSLIVIVVGIRGRTAASVHTTGAASPPLPPPVTGTVTTTAPIVADSAPPKIDSPPPAVPSNAHATTTTGLTKSAPTKPGTGSRTPPSTAGSPASPASAHPASTGVRPPASASSSDFIRTF